MLYVNRENFDKEIKKAIPLTISIESPFRNKFNQTGK